MKTKIVQIVGSINANAGGATKAILQRVGLFVKNNIDVEIIFIDFKIDQFEIFKQEFERYNGFIFDGSKIQLTSFHESMSAQQEMRGWINSDDKKEPHQQVMKSEELTYTEKPFKNGFIQNYYKNGLPTHIVHMNEDKKVKMIDYYNEMTPVVVRRDFYYAKNNKARSIHYDAQLNPIYEQYFSKNGYCYMYNFIKLKKSYNFVLHTQSSITSYQTMQDILIDFIDTHLKKYNVEDITIFADSMASDIASRLQSKCKKIAIIHSNTYKNKISGKMNGLIDTLIKNNENITRIVALTHAQKKDIVNYNKSFSGKTIVIPHGIDRKNTITQRNNHIVTVSRLSIPQKVIDIAILAFAQIMHLFPDVTYHIYGDGNVKNELKKLIYENNLEQRVFLHEYTRDPDAVFNTSLFSVMPTTFEGFCLSCLESLANGCPVVISDIKYGPSEMVKNGINGMLVVDNTVPLFAEAMKTMLSDRKKLLEMQQNSIKIADEFSVAAWAKSWLAVVDEDSTQEAVESVADEELTISRVFEDCYLEKKWGGGSGHGSNPVVTKGYREFLVDFLYKNKISSIADIGCGDMQFTKFINFDGIQYTGYDVVESLIKDNISNYKTGNINFVHYNGDFCKIEKADIAICKDVLQHLPNNLILNFISNLHKFKYALIANDLDDNHMGNKDILAGRCRSLDLRMAPFNLECEKVYTIKRVRPKRDIAVFLWENKFAANIS